MVVAAFLLPPGMLCLEPAVVSGPIARQEAMAVVRHENASHGGLAHDVDGVFERDMTDSRPRSRAGPLSPLSCGERHALPQ
ncbi:hypothetical protein QFZ49_005756 [Streptomyces turgidiscabies]|uniref:Secreted protein n=1 Tax=Streptomyces turgidiscabies TaxID=85558 RepID=A0ABU0RUW5_9ACTN|nr:hypothetical protein [Streptomyces turgidiscabies]